MPYSLYVTDRCSNAEKNWFKICLGLLCTGPANLSNERLYVCRQMDTFAVQALGKGGLLHSNKGHKKLPDWVNGHVTSASVCFMHNESCLCTEQR